MNKSTPPAGFRALPRLAWISGLLASGFLAASLWGCSEDPATSPGTVAPNADPRYLPVPSLTRVLDPGLREARILMTGYLNRVHLVLRLRGPELAQFRRTDWEADGSCDEAYVQSSSICSYDWRCCPTGTGFTWEASIFGCDLADIPSRRLVCRVTSQAHGARGWITSWPEEGKPGLDADWVLSDDGRTCDWIFFTKARGSSPRLLELHLAGREDGLQDVRAVCGDTVSWEGSLSATGDRGEMRMYGRARKDLPWTLRHEIRWAGGHGEWTPAGRTW